MFIAALFIIQIAKYIIQIYNNQTWKQPKCSQTDEWIKKMQNICIYIHSTFQNYSTFYIYSRICVCVYIYINTHNGLLLSHKKKERIPLVAVWMDLEISY